MYIERFIFKKAFTLAEIMIALVVIGVITSILLPVAFNNVPNENVMKFKKGNATLAKIINELVTSGEYYKDGDLGIKADGTIIDGSHDGDKSYFCDSFADVIAVKINNCHNKFSKEYAEHGLMFLKKETGNYNDEGEITVNQEILNNFQNGLDLKCKSDIGRQLGNQLVLADNIVFYETSNSTSFGASFPNSTKRYFSNDGSAMFKDINGFGLGYKIICMNINGNNDISEDYNPKDDAINNNWLTSTSNCDDVKNVCPFGYGIRADGKIILGKHAQEWLEKSIQDK